MSSIPVLLPLTIDRFVALVFPLKYKQVIITRTCKIMISMTWIPLLLVFIYDMVCLGNKGKEVCETAELINAAENNWHK